jgi:hypothetical protein
VRNFKIKKQIVAIAAAIALSGCATNSGVTKVGNNTYRVSTRATWEFGGLRGARIAALSEATKFAQEHGGTVQIISKDEDYNHFNGGTVDLTFTVKGGR